MEIPGGGRSNVKPPGMENPVGWGVKLEKTLRGGGMDIFWNHTITELIIKSNWLQVKITTYFYLVSFSQLLWLALFSLQMEFFNKISLE